MLRGMSLTQHCIDRTDLSTSRSPWSRLDGTADDTELAVRRGRG